MIYAGEFINVKGAVVRVEIRAGAGSGTVEIGASGSGMAFAGDSPVTIDGEAEEIFDVLLRRSATVRLLVRDFQVQFFAADCRDVPVTISVGGRCVFSGYVEPQSYSQPFNDVEELLELHCIDVLTALEYRLYGDVGRTGVIYSALRSDAQNVSLLSLLQHCLGTDAVVWYDGSVRSSRDGSRYGVFAELGVSELLFLGDGEDDVWSCQAVLEEVLRYLNLHIRQEGDEFYIFSWASVTAGSGSIAWGEINPSPVPSQEVSPCQVIDISLPMAEDCNTQVSVGEVYNRLELTAEVKSTDEVVESPLDSDSLVSPYTWYQKYMTEYHAGIGSTGNAWNAFIAMLGGDMTTYDKAKETDWFVQVMQHPRWKFYGWQDPDRIDLAEHFCSEGRHQQGLLFWLGQRHIGAALLRLGKVERKPSSTDNSLVSKVTMNDHLVVSVNGETNEQVLLNAMPVAEYTGQVGGGVFSPADNDTTNYIVLSGKITLSPIMEVTDHDSSPNPFDHVYSESSDTKTRFYTRRFWTAETPRSVPLPAEASVDGGRKDWWHPHSDDCEGKYPYNYSAAGNTQDMTSKIKVLACMLIVGDKCVVETGKDGQVGDFEWRPYKERAACSSDDEYFSQCFFIGFDPKIGDALVGREYPFQNNIDYTLGLDTEGIAIRIHKDDEVSGRVQFKILGPTNIGWGVVTRIHPSFWRSTRWEEKEVDLLDSVKSIILSDFKVKIHTDNGLVAGSNGDDLVYMSDTDEAFINKKDDLAFKLTSALTAADARQLGVSTEVALSTPVVTRTGLGVQAIYDAVRGLEGKAEKLYVDDYYTRCHVPKVVLEETLGEGSASPWLRYRHPALPGRVFHVVSISRDLREGTARLLMREE